MSNIEWKEGAVCFADGQQWFTSEEIYLTSDCSLYSYNYENIINCDDFQLNEPRIGDYIPKSELDTEQKYNDAVDELGLFGLECETCYESMIRFGGLLLELEDSFCSATNDESDIKRKITYVQLMAIGKLKHLINERDKVNTSEKPNSSELKDGDKYIRTIYGLCGTPVKVDVYRVSDAFPTGSSSIDHAVKKMLCAGLRGHKDKLTDIDNAIESLQAARLLLIQKGEV